MTPIEAAALRVVRDLHAEGHRCALVGGIAVSVRAAPRTTGDVDFAVDVSSDAEAEALVRRLLKKGYQLREVLEQTVVDRLATARFRMEEGPSRPVGVDLLFASSGIESEVVAAADELEVLPGSLLPVAQRGHLLALKVLAYEEDRRPQDRQDILALLGSATRRDLEIARQAVALITKRGFHRDKDLADELERFEGRVETLRREQKGSTSGPGSTSSDDE